MTAEDRNSSTTRQNVTAANLWRPSSVTAEDHNDAAVKLIQRDADLWRPSSVTAEDHNAWPRSSWFRGLPRGGRPDGRGSQHQDGRLDARRS